MIKLISVMIMITNHIIKEDCVILYFDYSFEIGSFGKNQEKKSILNQIYEYLKNTKINIDGKKILLMLGSTLVATLIYTGGMIRLDSLESPSVSNIQTVEKVEIANTDTNHEYIEEQQKEVEDKKEVVEEKSDENSSTNSKPSKGQLANQTINKKPNSTSVKVEVVDKNEETANKHEEVKTEEKENLITVYRSNGIILELQMEEYIVGVVAAEMPASFNIEALKAQAVIARTYALKKISRGEVLTDTVSTQSYIDVFQMKEKWGNDYAKYYNKIVNAVNSTKGEYLIYDGEYIEAVYHSTSNGYTEAAVNVWGKSYPYLKSVESSWDKSVNSYLKITNKELETVLNILGISYDENIPINIIKRNDSGRVSQLKIGEKIFSGIEFRNLLGLRSTDFDIEINNDVMTIITRGYGHGVGMSQYGANEMAKKGYNYQGIINHYYNGVKLSK
ncbi:MAG: stage II sporulation protein D [Firmicutes bacterium]|nr:stage II sporulation protein D [Bacillota bacterium]